MSRGITALSAGIGSLVLAVCVFAWAAPSTQPTTGPSDHSKGRAGWGFSPYNKLSGMSEEQKMKINEIHRKFIADRKALEDKQDADVAALLTDEQKVELEKMKADEKAKAAEHRKSGKDKEEDEDKEKDKK